MQDANACMFFFFLCLSLQFSRLINEQPPSSRPRLSSSIFPLSSSLGFFTAVSFSSFCSAPNNRPPYAFLAGCVHTHTNTHTMKRSYVHTCSVRPWLLSFQTQPASIRRAFVLCVSLWPALCHLRKAPLLFFHMCVFLNQQREKWSKIRINVKWII